MIVSLLSWNTPQIQAIEEFLGEKITVCASRASALEVLPEAEIVITLGGAPLLDAEMLASCRKLKLVLSISAGVEKLPIQALHDRDIAVCNTKGAHAVSIAEFVLGGMLAMSHHYPRFIRDQDKRHWEMDFTGNDLDGQTLLVIGAGAIGTEIGKKAKAFDMKVIGLRRRPAPAAYFDEVLGIAALHEALPCADFAVMATPLTDETYRLMGTEEFKLMKSTAVFINISRGDTVDEAALSDALLHKQLAGAVLDVFHQEPLPQDSPLWAMENVIVTPHSAGATSTSVSKTIRLLCDNIARFKRGQPLVNRIEKGETY